MSPRPQTSLAVIAAGGFLCLAAAGGLMGCPASASRDPSVVFESDWSTDTGSSRPALTDGGRWSWEADFGGGKLMSVVPGGPGGRNAMRVVQRGGSLAAFVGKDNVVPPSTDYYVRFYMRNDDTSPTYDHGVVPDYLAYQNLTYVRKAAGPSGWRFTTALFGCTWIYPISYMASTKTLSNGVWYRFEYFVDFVDATHVQVHVRVYDPNGTQVLGDADFLQEDPGSAVWNGRSDWTLASLYASDFSYCVKPAALTKFAMGNNGQKDAVDTGLSWYYAGVQIRTDWWPGP